MSSRLNRSGVPQWSAHHPEVIVLGHMISLDSCEVESWFTRFSVGRVVFDV